MLGRRWIDSLPLRLGSRASEYARDAVAFAVSLGQIVIPTAGAYLLTRALDTTGLAGAWARPILMVLPVAALIWLMIVPMLVKIDFAALGQVKEHWRGIGVTLTREPGGSALGEQIRSLVLEP